MPIPSKVLLVAGARPNFMKVAPLMRALAARADLFHPMLVHTGQHYDFVMSDVFFRDLDMPKPDLFLNVGSGSHAVQTAKVMIGFEEVVLKEKPGLVIVVGDVNSTLACALVAAKLQVKVAHVEAGLRSFDRTMPEEINRAATDAVSDLLFASEPSGVEHLRREGIPDERIHFVGNVMIDTLLASMGKIEGSAITEKLRMPAGTYAVATVHRPSNVDTKESLEKILAIFAEISRRLPLIYPVHPRTRQRIRDCGLEPAFKALSALQFIEPLGYVDFVALVRKARLVVTDSGGIQEETTVLRVPCLTMRENTERPVTVTEGTNQLVGTDSQALVRAVDAILKGRWKKGSVPEHWDGHAAERIAAVLAGELMPKPPLERTRARPVRRKSAKTLAG